MKETSPARLRVQEAEFYAYHGVKGEERKLGGKYSVDLELLYDSTSAAINDDVKYALNYEEAMFCVSEVMNGESYHLIETMAIEILNIAMEKFPQLIEAKVRIRKLNVPMRRVVGCIEIEQSIRRKD